LVSASIRGAVSLLALASACATSEAEPTPTLLAPLVNVATSTQTDGASGALVVVIDGLKAPVSPAGPPEGVLTSPSDLTDAADTPPTVKFAEKVIPLASSGNQRRWILPFKVYSMPAGENSTRYVTFQIDKVEWALSYQLATPAAVPTTWTLKPASTSPQSLMMGDKDVGLPVLVTIAGNLPVTGLTVSADPIEKDLKRSHSKGGWKLCKEQMDATCKEPLTLTGAGMHKLWVMPASPGDLEVGKYDAVITVASTEKPVGESVSLAVNVTSLASWIAGFGLIAAGCLLATYFTVVLRSRIQRDEMLEPVVRLREAHDKVEKVVSLADQGNVASTIRAKLNYVNTNLKDTQLEVAGLPKSLPPPWTKPVDATRIEKFKQYVEAQANWLNSIEVLISAGVVALVNVWKDAGSKPETQADLDKAILAVDALANQAIPPVPSSLGPVLAEEVTKFETKLGLAAGGGAARQLRTLQELRLSVSRTTFAAWAILIAVTVLVGGYSLILLNPGFGTKLDLVACFLWGLGLPTGAALASATTSTVATSLNVVRIQ
jgi:hypothetical protein